MYARVYKTVIWDYSTYIILFFKWLLSINCLTRKNDENSFKRNITTKCHLGSVYSGVCGLWPYEGRHLVNMGGIQIIGPRLFDAPLFYFRISLYRMQKEKENTVYTRTIEYANVCIDVWPMWWFKQLGVSITVYSWKHLLCVKVDLTKDIFITVSSQNVLWKTSIRLWLFALK